MSLRPIPALLFALALLVAFALAPVIYPNPQFRIAMGDLIPLLISTATVIVMVRNVSDSRGPTRLFWALMMAGMITWWVNQAGWVWFEVVQRRPLPDPFYGD